MRKRSKRKQKIIFWSTAVGLLTAALMLIMIVLLDGRHREIVMLGGESVTLSYGAVYEDPGVEIQSVGRILPAFTEPEIVYALNQPDTTKLGEQEMEYFIADRGETLRMVRRVTVVDEEAPQIELFPIPEGQTTSWMNGYVEPGFQATDNADGDLTDIVEVTQLNDRVIYTVTDSSGNETLVEREFPVALDAPEIELSGGEDLTFSACMSWEDPGYRVLDAQGNDLSEFVTVEGTVTPYRSGEYTITYTLTNVLGESVTALRRVTVEPIRQSDTAYPDKKTIYLTFDDGPGPYTDQLLDVLARYNVKATFFVTGNRPGYNDCIGRAYREGHSIAVHSFTHNYRNIYASEEAYFNDFQACEDLIFEQTGSYTALFRFPGGSSNTVSRFNPGIMSRLTKSMTDMGYYYYDWNVDSNDAGGASSSNEVYWNVVNGCVNNSNVVLQHDIKDFSVAAVERIIIWGLNNGFQFLPLEESSYGAHHGVNN